MIPLQVPQFDDSSMTPEVADAARRLAMLMPELLRGVKGIQSNPALESNGLEGQWTPERIIEINPITSKRMSLVDLMTLIGHEASHGKNGPDEQKARAFEDQLRQIVLSHVIRAGMQQLSRR